MLATSAVHRLAIPGHFGIYSAAAIRDDLLAAFRQAGEVEVDLSQVVEIDSTGLQLMIAAKQEAAAQEKTLRFVNHSPAVLDALDLADLAAHLGDPVLLPSRA